MREIAEHRMAGKRGSDLVAQRPPAKFDVWLAVGRTNHNAAFSLLICFEEVRMVPRPNNDLRGFRVHGPGFGNARISL